MIVRNVSVCLFQSPGAPAGVSLFMRQMNAGRVVWMQGLIPGTSGTRHTCLATRVGPDFCLYDDVHEQVGILRGFAFEKVDSEQIFELQLLGRRFQLEVGRAFGHESDYMRPGYAGGPIVSVPTGNVYHPCTGAIR